MHDPHEDEHRRLRELLDEVSSMRDRLPVRVPGYPEPMVPLTIAERDAVVDTYFVDRMKRAKRPLVIQSGEPDIDRLIASVLPDELDNRPAVEVDGQLEPMVLLTEDERYQLVKTLMTLAGRIRSLGEARSMRELMQQEDDETRNRMTDHFIQVIVDASGGVGVAREIVEAVIDQLERTADPVYHTNANALRQALAAFVEKPSSAN